MSAVALLALSIHGVRNPFPWRSGESLSLNCIASDCYYIPKIRESLIRSHCIPVQTGDRLQRSLIFSDLGVGDMRLAHPRQAAHALSLSDYNLTTFEVMCDGRQAKRGCRVSPHPTTPIRRGDASAARRERGHATAAPPMSVMNSRRFMCPDAKAASWTARRVSKAASAAAPTSWGERRPAGRPES
jgi:hypothetical protein